METKIKMHVDTQKKTQNMLEDISAVFGEAMYYLPPNKRQIVVNKIQDDILQKTFQLLLPMYKELDKKIWLSLLSALSGDTEALKQNEK